MMQFDDSLSSPSMAPPEPPPSPPSASTPAPRERERIAAHLREALTDLAGIALAAYLVQRNAIAGTHALLFALALLLPSPVIVRVAHAIAARARPGNAGPAALALALAGAYSKLKLTALGLAALAASSACGPNFGAVTPIVPRVIVRPEFGTCVESGGRTAVPAGPTLTLLTQACLSFDGGASEPPAPDASDGDAVEGPPSERGASALVRSTHTLSRPRGEERR